MGRILTEFFIVFAILQLFFAYFEYQYKADLFYVLGRLVTAEKYWIPSIIIPLAYIILSRLIGFML